MNLVITLLANPEKEPLLEAFVQSMPASLATQGLVVQKIDTLKEGVACDLYISSPLVGEDQGGGAVGKILQRSPHPNPPPQGGRGFLEFVDMFVQQVVADQPYDAIVQPVATRRKKLLISDMDSTMITVECIDELADFVGKKAEVSIITDRAMSGELDFAAALTERVALLRGLSEKMLQEAYDERVKMMGGAKALVSHMRASGARCVLVSGGFTFFTSRVREELGFHADFSNQLEIQHGMLTGRVIPPILGKEAKLATTLDECKTLGISADEVVAIGDGANDLPMLLNAGLGVAYHAKPIVRAQANARLNYCDLSALVFAMGSD